MQVEKLFFMAKKGWNDLIAWYRAIPLHLAVHETVLGYYYIRFPENPKRLNRLIAAFDAEGVPMNTTYVDVEEKRLHYYPISIGQYGLAVFHTWLDGGAEDKKAHFLRIADWFYQNRTESEVSGTYWLTDIPKPEFGGMHPGNRHSPRAEGYPCCCGPGSQREMKHTFRLQSAPCCLLPWIYPRVAFR